MTRSSTARPESGARADEISLARQLAHDARSPISALVVLSSSLKDQLGEAADDQPRYHLDLLHNAALSLNALMGDVADLGREGEFVAPGTRASFSLADILNDVRNLLLPVAQLRGVPIEVRSDEPDWRTGFPAAIRRVLLGLASVPLRMGGDRPLEITAVQAGAPEGDQVLFSVRTEGPGPEPEVLEAVDAVARGERPRDRSCFAHLGLELSLRLLEEMGSRLDWEARTAEGTRLTFQLTLPPAEPSN